MRKRSDHPQRRRNAGFKVQAHWQAVAQEYPRTGRVVCHSFPQPAFQSRSFSLPHGKLALGFGAVALVAVGAGASGNGLVHDARRELVTRPSATEQIVAAGYPPVVAVLPFQNMSGNPGENYFADGLTEDIIADLARNRDLLVIARNSTFAFKDRATDIRTIGSELGAGYVVEGSARRSATSCGSSHS